MDRIRVGIVGATLTKAGSGWGANAHVPALSSLPGYQLKAVCTAHEESARASAAAFGAELAFNDFERMIAHPDIDVIAVVVRAPWHHAMTMSSLRAGKATFCEWPLGANLKEAEEMAGLARERSLPAMVGLQARSDPAVMTAREMIAQGYIGDALLANLKVISAGQYERGAASRLWMGERRNGAGPMTIAGSHAMDAVRCMLGEFAQVAARVTTRIPEWLDTDNKVKVKVDTPDSVSVAARLTGGCEVSIQVATVPVAGPGFSLEIYGTKGRLSLASAGVNLGPNKLLGARGSDALAELPVPERFRLAPAATPAGHPMNVAQSYMRWAEPFRRGKSVDPDFDTALGMHRVVDAIERSSETGKTVTL